MKIESEDQIYSGNSHMEVSFTADRDKILNCSILDLRGTKSGV
jgi:hypothetical protein